MEATEYVQREMEGFPASLNTSRPTRWRASHRGPPDLDPDMTKEVHRCVAKKMRQLPAYSGATVKEDFTSEER